MRTRKLTKTLAGIGIALMVSAFVSAEAGARSSTHSNATESSLLPAPTGPLPVGVRTVVSVAPDSTTRVWYPARRGSATGAPVYLAEDVAATYGLPAELLRRAVPAASSDAAPAIARRRRPVVVLMPGWGLPMALSTALAQDLASHGYVVVAVDPTPGSEDGMTMPADPANPGRRLEQLSAALDFATSDAIDRVAGPVDHRRIAVGGHSIAGAVAFQAGLTDTRIHAVFDLDGWLHGPALTTPIGVPALMVNASGLEPQTRAIVDHSQRAVTVTLSEATHLDVTDVPCLVAPLPEATRSALGLGAIGCAGTTTTDTVVRRFLDAVLRDGTTTPRAASLTHGLGRQGG